jgi:hypothetical protein
MDEWMDDLDRTVSILPHRGDLDDVGTKPFYVVSSHPISMDSSSQWLGVVVVID